MENLRGVTLDRGHGQMRPCPRPTATLSSAGRGQLRPQTVHVVKCDPALLWLLRVRPGTSEAPRVTLPSLGENGKGIHLPRNHNPPVQEPDRTADDRSTRPSRIDQVAMCDPGLCLHKRSGINSQSKTSVKLPPSPSTTGSRHLSEAS